VRIAQVVIINKFADFDRPLDYQVPPGISAPVGSLVQVPLGSRMVEGVVFSHSHQSEVDNLKDIAAVLNEVVPTEFVELANWLALRAGCSISSALSAMLPPASGGNPQVRWQVDEIAAAGAELTEKQQQVVDYLQQQPPLLKSEICRALNISMTPINSLVQRGILLAAETREDSVWITQEVDVLTAEQTAVISRVLECTGNLAQGGEFLLYGVTGSGKTEVYIRLAQRARSQGHQALILVPEIALTAQLVARFRKVFAQDVAVLHSGLSASVRAVDWDKISRGEIGIVIGTRSAVFAPLPRLGLIVVDEEHEPAFKQEETPRYHARDIALFRGRWHRAAVVLGSATPALESFARSEAGRYQLVKMPSRIHSQESVAAEIVDMRKELQQGNRDMLSRPLRQALEDTLANNEQALLFLNRRGVAPTVLCRSCGFRYSCPNCSTALTLHGNRRLKCHHCGAAAILAPNCPSCGSKYLRELGLGTQKLETRLLSLFPNTVICRLDRDTADSAAAKELHLSKFYQEESGILLGTQMIAKGLDFPKVTLVGVVLADLSLGMTDFRAAERTFQLVTQAAGRTGRGSKPGRVIVQTYQPEHYSLKYAVAGDYQGFYKHEMRQRAAGGMPPFSALTRILVSATEEKRLLAQVEHITALLDQGDFELLFSGPPPLEKLKGRYRWHFLLRHPGTGANWRAIDGLRKKIKQDKHSRTVFDNNPYNFM